MLSEQANHYSVIVWYSALTVLSLSDEIIMHEGVTAVYKVNVDLFFAVLGAQNENEVRYLRSV